MDFTISKLRCAGNYQGLFILRCSPRDYDRYYLSFVVGVSRHFDAAGCSGGRRLTAVFQHDGALDYKHCLIVKTEDGQFVLSGAKRSCGSIRELLHCYQREALRADGYTFQLSRCCPPSLKGQQQRSP